ncbi:MAG: isoprenyl transferase [Pseudomonadota bacterium]
MKSDVAQAPPGAIPRHIAIIMDGNGRWARTHRFTRIMGHRRGAENVRAVVTACCNLGVEVLTLYAFSEENWGRPRTETAALMKILTRFLVSERKLLEEKRVRLATIGDVSKLPPAVYHTLRETMLLTQANRRMTLVLALSYGGRDEITRAVQAISRRVRDHKLDPQDIDEDLVASHLDTAGLPDPDLLIRTSGEMRISNFLPWQIAYTEIYVTPVFWPEFTREELLKAIREFGHRERRFGLTAEQVAKSKAPSRWKSAI